MKAIRLLLSLSVVVNLALFVVLALTPTRERPASKPALPVVVAAPAGISSNTNGAGGQTSVATAPASDRRSTDIWSRLDTEDTDQLVTRLKESGFTYREIRAIVLAIGQRKFEAARASLRGRQEDTPYWRPSSLLSENPDQRAKEMELMNQENAFYRKHFAGPDTLAENEDAADYARKRYGDLPVEKLQRLARVQSDYDELQQKIYAGMQSRKNPRPTDDERKQLALLQKELQHDIRQSLTPEEFQEYQMRSSPTANRLRSQLELLRPTEAEYKALFSLQLAVDEQYDSWNADEQTRRAQADAIKNLGPQIQAVLGPERYADYQQLMKSSGDKVTRLMSRLGLPLATVGKIDSIRQDAGKSANTIREDLSLTSAERKARLSALVQDTEARLTATLGGPRGFEAFVDLNEKWRRDLRAISSAP